MKQYIENNVTLKELNTDRLKFDILKSLVGILLVLAIIVISIVLYFQNKNLINIEKKNYDELDYTLRHVVIHEGSRNEFLLKRMVSSGEIATFLKHNQKEQMYTMLKPRYDLLRSENQNFLNLHVIKADGTSYLRMHQKDKFADRLDDIRPMVKEMINNHKMIKGYETGRQGTFYRVMLPLFYEKEFVGLIEVGLNPNYFIEEISNILGDIGILFVQQDKLNLYSSEHGFHIDDYILQSRVDETTLELLNFIKKVGNFKKSMILDTKESIYFTYVHEVVDFAGVPYAKYIFFQNASSIIKDQNKTIVYIIFSVSLFVLVLFFIIKFYINKFSNKVTSFYEESIRKLNFAKNYLSAVENSSSNIILSFKDNKISTVNETFLKFTGFESLSDFNKKYTCIGNFFIEREGYLPNFKNIEEFSKYLHNDLNKLYKAVMLKNDKEYIVSVKIDKLSLDDSTRYVLTLSDITELENLQKELEVQQELMLVQSRHAAMGEMISMIAHQWRQPLGVISMAANNIIADVQLEIVSDKELLDVSQEILDETMYLSKTIDDFRDFFKPNKNIEDVLLEDVFEEALGVMGKSFENNNITLHKNFTCNIAIETYARELMQVFLNLLKNSQEALIELAQDDKMINVTCKEFSNRIIFEITDNAGGIKEEIIDKIFEPYFSTKDEKVGTGLGLYMSKTIIEKHLKGTIRVYNNNEGAVFEIILPKHIGQWDRRKNERENHG